LGFLGRGNVPDTGAASDLCGQITVRELLKKHHFLSQRIRKSEFVASGKKHGAAPMAARLPEEIPD
jgi:hypothetical protein